MNTETHTWGGRFRKHLDENFKRLNATLTVDRRLFEADVQVSFAWAECLFEASILRPDELSQIRIGLKSLLENVRANPTLLDQAVFEGVEDVHSFVEAKLFKMIGEPALKLNTGRSRNDQVVTDLRIWTRDHISLVVKTICSVQKAIVKTADNYKDITIPSYTHLQRAQPVLLAHHLLAYFEMFERDKSRLLQARERLNMMPIGSGAVAGTSFAVDREKLANTLGFSGPCKNSMDAVSDRDFVIEVVSNLSLISIHLSRLCEDLILFSTKEFGILELDDSVTTGSSLMPQKKNADSLELIRGKTGRVCGNLQALFMIMKALPMAYNKDMAEDKERLFDSVDTVLACLKVMATVVETLVVNKTATTLASQDGGLLATEIADYLAKKGIPFRKAHHIVGQLVLKASEDRLEITSFALSDFQAVEQSFDSSVFSVLTPEAAIAAKNVTGGTSRLQVRQRLEAAARSLE